MKTLYLDCGMGAAGDMLAAALLELLPDPDAAIAELNGLGIPGVVFTRARAEKCGICGTHLTVAVNGQTEDELPIPAHDHAHAHDHGHDHAHDHAHGEGDLHGIEHIVRALPVSAGVREAVMDVYSRIAEAESFAHGVGVTDVHFCEVGRMDAVADITAACLLMEKLAVEQVVVSPVHVGSGQVRCSHGVLPVPAPATARILRGAPIYGGSVKGELCTPTGAALLTHFASAFGDMPVMRVQLIGYGMGKKDFEAANCVRAMLGETQEDAERVCELMCNLDDMTGEGIGFAMDRFFEAGALDAFTVPIGMKKSRPGILLSVLCREADRDAMLRLMFSYTTTLGVREKTSRRYTMRRTVRSVDTPLGKVRQKTASGYGVTRAKYEYNDLARIAIERDMSLADVLRQLTE